MIPITVELRLDDGIYFNEILVIVRLNELSIIESIYTNVSFCYITAGRENSELSLYKPLASHRLT